MLVLCGDINADFSRNTGFVNYVKTQFDDLRLETAWKTHDADFTFVYTDSDDKSFTAVLDHFVYNEVTQQGVLEVGTLHIPENLSDHCPIFCTIDIESIPVDKSVKKQETHSKPSWKKATEEEKENYTKSLEDKLSSIEVPEGLSCSDVKCKDTNHCNDADEFITSVLECVESAASSSISIPTKFITSIEKTCPWLERFCKTF